jgi:tetratricopeptide (TPR) repeat protein
MYQGLLHNDAGDWGSARRHFEKALEQFGNLTGRYGNDPQYRHFKRHEAEAEHNFGIYWNNRRLFDDALNHYGRALRIRQELAAQAPLPEYVSDVARSHGWIGDVHVELQQWDKAREAYEQSLKLREELARQWPRDLETLFQFARGINNFGTLNLRKGDPAEALKHFARGVKIQETLVQEVPGKSEYRGDLGWTLNRLGAMQLALKNDDPEGRKNLQRSLDIYSRLYAVDPKVTYASNLGWSHAYLARSYLDAEPGKALPHLLEALDHLDKVVQMRHKEKVNVAPDDLYLLAFSRALGRELIQNPKAALAAEQKEQIQKQADEALPALQRACQAGYIASYYLENDRGMNSLRGFPEFKQLVQQAKEREKNQ